MGRQWTNDTLYDFIAVGIGPFNLSLACLCSPLQNISCLFLDKAPDFSWHPGLLIEGTTLQNPFLADMVSMADPTSSFSYLNYCKQKGHLYNFYIREDYYPSRLEFNNYCRWTTEQLDNLHFSHEVQGITFDEAGAFYVIEGLDLVTNNTFYYKAKKLVIGVGSEPQLPDVFDDKDQAYRVHSSHYLPNKSDLMQCKNITVVGSGQSGAEVFYDLLCDPATREAQINWVSRASRFFQMETGKLTLDLITPDYTDYFFDLEQSDKKSELLNQRNIYTGVNQSLINKIYDLLDDRRENKHCFPQILPNLILEECRRNEQSQNYELVFNHKHHQQRYQHNTDGLVMATGYHPLIPKFISGVEHKIRWTEKGRYIQAKNWSVDVSENEIFVQNAGVESHGLSNPDIGLSCYRNSELIRHLTGHDYYPQELQTSYQQFSPKEHSGFIPLTSGMQTR